MEAMLALAFDLSGWRGPVAFAAVGIFVVAALARLMSVLSERRRRRVWLSEGYKSREDVRIALREENIDDWLEKMRSTPHEFKVSKPIPEAGVRGGVFDLLDAVSAAMKETSKGVEEIVSLKKIENALPSIEEHGPQRIYPKGYKPDFRFSWYRAENGSLILRTSRKDLKVSDDNALFAHCCGLQDVTTFEGLRVAYPEVGEWWVKMRCDTHYIDKEVRLEIAKEYSWYRTPNRIAELYCGCLAPINFGKGFQKVAGSEYLAGGAGADGGSGLAGGAGSPGSSVIEPPHDTCSFCSGMSEVVEEDGPGSHKVVPCPRCKGTGRGS